MHRYETNRIRNIATFFSHLLSSDALPWTLLSCIKLTEDDTTSSSRIFIKILIQTLYEAMGINELKMKLEDPGMRDCLIGLFPVDDPQNIRFSINYFTSIGLGPLTDRMREILKFRTANMTHPSDDDEPSPRELSEHRYPRQEEKYVDKWQARPRSPDHSRSDRVSYGRDRSRHIRSPPVRTDRSRSREHHSRRRSPSPYNDGRSRHETSRTRRSRSPPHRSRRN